MKYFDVDMSTMSIEEGKALISHREVDGVPSAVVVARGRGGMPLPIGCSTISVPVNVRCADGYWFAGLFRLPEPITVLGRKPLFECISSFLPHLLERRMIVSKLSSDCFRMEGRRYKLFVPNCELHFNPDQKGVQ